MKTTALSFIPLLIGFLFAGLALASASDICLTPRSRSERRDYLTRLRMVDLVGEYG